MRSPAPRHHGEHTKHANLAWQTAGGQRWFAEVVVTADVVLQVGGTTRHPQGGGTEEARTERACVRRSQGGSAGVGGVQL